MKQKKKIAVDYFCALCFASMPRRFGDIVEHRENISPCDETRPPLRSMPVGNLINSIPRSSVKAESSLRQETG